MPFCATCGKEYERLTATHRVNCYTCAPFGKTLRKPEPENWDSVCAVCGRKYVYVRQKGHTKTKCNNCSVNDRRIDIKLRALAYKGGKCAICGYSKCVRALNFHHVGGNKDFGVAANHCRKWDDVKVELDKCVLLCSNCHMEVHEGLVTIPPVG
jgi:DNA-directed RNA polymerase subunit RPC12/RpoP